MAKLMQKIFLDMLTVCELLQGRAAVICCDVRLPGQRLKARGSVFLRANAAYQIAAAIIESGDSRLLYSGDAALSILNEVAAWSVYFTGDVEIALADYLRRLGIQPSGKDSTQDKEQRGTDEEQESLQGETPIRRLMPLPDSMLEVLSLKDRVVIKTVWSMINDQRSLHHIQSLLKLPPAVVEEAIESLRLFHVIE